MAKIKAARQSPKTQKLMSSKRVVTPVETGVQEIFEYWK